MFDIHTREIVRRNIDIAWTEVHCLAECKHGDITPEQTERLDKIIEDLTELINEQTHQNL